MKPATTLKELLKPPFTKDKICHVYDSKENYILSITSTGWTKKIHNQLEAFVVAALNEKWERDFGEPLRWILMDGRGDIVTCPYCRLDYRFGIFIDWEKNNYCPRCGKKVQPPTKEGA